MENSAMNKTGWYAILNIIWRFIFESHIEFREPLREQNATDAKRWLNLRKKYKNSTAKYARFMMQVYWQEPSTYPWKYKYFSHKKFSQLEYREQNMAPAKITGNYAIKRK